MGSENMEISEQELESLVTDEPENKDTQEKKTEAETNQTEPSEEELAEAALEITEEHDPKDAVIGGFRRKLREAELENARLQGKIEAQSKPPEAEKSPIELAAEEQNVNVNDVVVDGKLYKDQQAWEKQQAQKKTEQEHRKEFDEAGRKAHQEMNDAVFGKGLGLSSLEELGGHLLTQGDFLDVYQAGKDCGKVLMKRLRYRLVESGGELKKELLNRVKAHKSQTTKDKDKGKSEQTVPTQEQVLEDSAGPVLDSIFFEA